MPIGPEPANQMRPFDFLCAAPKNMRDVGAIEPFAFHDVRLHPNHFFRCAKFHMQALYFIILGALEPRVIDFAQSIAGAKNQINVIAPAPGLGEPMRKCFFRFVSGASKRFHGSIDMSRPNVQIEIF